jgi:hypothetical protein
MVTVASAAVATAGVPFLASSGAQTSWWVSVLIAVLAALIPLAGVIFVALQQKKNAEALEELKGELAEKQADASARREYEFEARKRLYSELYPLLFQLGEQSEAALFRIFGLARSARTGKLAPGSADNSKSRLRKRSPSYLPSTLYRFMAPLATYRLCERRLTSVDLSLDGDLQRKYRLAKLLYRSWSDGVEIAELEADHRPPCAYDPGGDSADASVSTQQHLSVQKIERVIESMLVQPAQGPIRGITLGEFFTSYKSDPAFARAIKPLRDLFVGFSPKSRPVLWRLLIVHAYLYAGLSGRAKGEPLLSVFDEQREDLSWLDPALDSSGHAKRDEPFLVAQAYLDPILPSPAGEGKMSGRS